MNETKSEELYKDYNNVCNKLEIQLQFDLGDIFKCIPLYSKINTKKSLLMFSYKYDIVDIFIKKETTNFYVTLENGEVILFNMLPIRTRYNLFKYILNLKNNGKLKQFLI